ncbi:MAG: hypothetical protein QOF02_1652 [Blastocatellia bacterium]|nr:hypothetical protein [Blastocatellia bacterium]
MKRVFGPLLVAVCCALLLSACGGSDTNSNNASTTNVNKSTTTTTTTSSTPAATSSTPAATTASTGEKIGIAECDDFLDKYDACVSDKVPAAARAQYQSSLAQWRKAWRDAAANPQTKATLAQQCKMIAEQTAPSMKSFGCTF